MIGTKHIVSSASVAIVTMLRMPRGKSKKLDGPLCQPFIYQYYSMAKQFNRESSVFEEGSSY